MSKPARKASQHKTRAHSPAQEFAPPHPATPEEQLAALNAVIPHLATKADLEKLRTDLKDEIGKVRTEITQFRGDMIKWFAGTALAIVAMLGGMQIGIAVLILRAEGAG